MRRGLYDETNSRGGHELNLRSLTETWSLMCLQVHGSLKVEQHCMNQLTDRKTTTFCHSVCLAAALHVISKCIGRNCRWFYIALSKSLFGRQWAGGNAARVLMQFIWSNVYQRLRVRKKPLPLYLFAIQLVRKISAFICNLPLLNHLLSKMMTSCFTGFSLEQENGNNDLLGVITHMSDTHSIWSWWVGGGVHKATGIHTFS